MSKFHYIFTDRTDTIRVTGNLDKAKAENKDGFISMQSQVEELTKVKGHYYCIIRQKYTEYDAEGNFCRDISKEDIVDLRESLPPIKLR